MPITLTAILCGDSCLHFRPYKVDQQAFNDSFSTLNKCFSCGIKLYK